jgi:hypothetical protein
MVPEVGIAPTSPPLQGGANLPQLLGEMVVPRGNAPRSSAYRADALLLSYRTENGSRGAIRSPSRIEFHPATPAAGLHAPINAKPRFTGVILPESWRAVRPRQHRKDLSLLLGDGLRLLWSSFLPSVPQPLRYILDYGHVGLLWLRFENWRKAWVARPPPYQRTVFSRQVQPAYICLPSADWLPGLDSHQH